MATQATLLSLPLELRHMIFEFALRDGTWFPDKERLEDPYAIPVITYFPRPESRDSEWNSGAKRMTRFLRTNKQIYREGTRLLNTRFNFVFPPPVIRCHIPRLLKLIPVKTCAMIRTITVSVLVLMCRNDRDARRGGSLAVFVDQLGSLTLIRNKLPALRTVFFKLSFHLDDNTGRQDDQLLLDILEKARLFKDVKKMIPVYDKDL